MIIERVVCERELETEQNCNILTPTSMATTAFLSRSPGLLNRGPGGPASLGAGFLYRILSSTDWTSCAPSYIIVRRPPYSCGRHKSHSFNPSTVKVIFWYSSTGFTCYLHRWISYFDCPAGSEVSIQHFVSSSGAIFTLVTTWMHAYAHEHTHMHICALTCTCTHTYAYTHIHM